jgi:hypothetical protein
MKLKINKTIIIILFFALGGFRSQAQRLEGSLDYFGFADNREYGASNRFSQTIFGNRLSPEVGIALDSVNHFRVGFNALYEFGSKGINKVDPVIYYRNTKNNWNFYIGAFPRQNLIDDYPRPLFKDTLNYYRPNMEGMLWKFENQHGKETMWIDWTSRQTNTEKETFLFGLSGVANFGKFYFSHYGYMFHNAGPAIAIPGDNLQDNGGAILKLGVNLSKKTFLDSLNISAGSFTTLERTRGVTDLETPTGLIIDAYAAYKKFSISNSFYTGQKHNSIYGDQFYTANTYNRLDVGWQFINYLHVQGKFVLSLHFVEGTVDNQQAFTLRYHIAGSKNIKKYLR